MLWEADGLGYTLWIDSSSSKLLWGHNPLHRNFEAIESSVIFTAPAWPSRTHPTLLDVQSSIHWPHVPKHSTKIYTSYGTQWTLSCRGFPLVLAREKAGRCSGLRNQAKQSSRVMTDIAVPKLEKAAFFPSLQTGEKFENNIKKKKTNRFSIASWGKIALPCSYTLPTVPSVVTLSILTRETQLLPCSFTEFAHFYLAIFGKIPNSLQKSLITSLSQKERKVGGKVRLWHSYVVYSSECLY